MMLKELVIALSLANLCFISAWRQLLIPSSFDFYYHQKTAPPTVEYVAVALDVLMLATLLFIGIALTRRTRIKVLKMCAKLAFVLILSVPVFGLLEQLNDDAVVKLIQPLVSDKQDASGRLMTAVLTAWAAVLILAFFRLNKAVRVAVAALQILVPFVLVTFTQSALVASRYRNVGAGSAAAPVSPRRERGPRVLWLVFDELDFRVAFAERPPTVDLGELDRLVSNSLFATNAYPPTGETFTAMPSLITGRLISEAQRAGPGELMVEFGDDTAAVPWSTQPNIFSRAREAGLNTALVGWYHPYCRILGSNLSKCAWEGTPPAFRLARQRRANRLDFTDAPDLVTHMREYAREAALTFPPAAIIYSRGPDAMEELRRQRVAQINNIYRQTVEAATDSRLDVVMIHWPIPHEPNVYNRSEERISVEPGRSYLDNLELVDRTVGDIRRAMESSGTWEETVVLITSDHWWRVGSLWKKSQKLPAEDEAAWGGLEDRRIPFILKMAGAGGERIAYTPAFNTVLTHDLLLAILHGEVSGTTGAAAWLDRHRSIGRSPYDERTYR